MRLILPLLFVVAPIFFAFGVTMPLVRFEKLIVFEETPSLVGIVSSLYDNGDIALAAIVALLSIVFPLAKMTAIAGEALDGAAGANGVSARLVPLLGKWSMMDVMLVALVIAAAKTSGLANAFSEPGLWFYAGSALSTTAAQWIVSRQRKA